MRQQTGRNRRRPGLGLIFLGVGVTALAGCMGREAIYRDVDASRARAYESWVAERTREQKSEALLQGKLGLDDAIKLGLRYNRNLQSTLEEKAKARGVVLENYSAALPSVSLESEYTRLDSRHNLGASFLDSYSADLQVVQPLFRGGAIPSALRTARLYAALADEMVRAQAQGVIFQIASAYYETLLAQHLYAVNLEAMKSAEAHLEDVKKKLAVGEATKFDVLRAEVDVANFRTEMIQQRNRIAVSKARLLRVMGVSQQSEVALGDELEYVAMQPVLEQAVRLALLNRPDLYQAELGVRMQREAVRIARSAYWPRIAAMLVQTLARPDPHEQATNAWGDQWVAGLTASWSLFDGLRREGGVKQEQAALRQRQIALEDVQEQALFEIQQAILTLHDAEEAVESQRLNVDRAEEALRLAQAGYKAGANSEIEVTDARSARTRAQGSYYQAVYSHTLARLQLQQAMGVLAPQPGSSEPPTSSPVPPARIAEFSKPEAQ